MFKGKIQSNTTINHDESCLNRIAMKSKRRGIVFIKLLNCLIASRIEKTREEHLFLKEIPPEKHGPFNLKKFRWTSTIVRAR